jgi:hypothetical protein
MIPYYQNIYLDKIMNNNIIALVWKEMKIAAFDNLTNPITIDEWLMAFPIVKKDFKGNHN